MAQVQQNNPHPPPLKTSAPVSMTSMLFRNMQQKAATSKSFIYGFRCCPTPHPIIPTTYLWCPRPWCCLFRMVQQTTGWPLSPQSPLQSEGRLHCVPSGTHVAVDRSLSPCLTSCRSTAEETVNNARLFLTFLSTCEP